MFEVKETKVKVDKKSAAFSSSCSCLAQLSSFVSWIMFFFYQIKKQSMSKLPQI